MVVQRFESRTDSGGRVELNYQPFTTELPPMTEYLNVLLAIIEAIYVDELNERETARLLGITRYQVRERHRRAIAILRGEA
jgi:hypothetical protein